MSIGGDNPLEGLVSNGAGGVMESLVEDLFAALYRDNNSIFDRDGIQS